ncbi:WD domain protein [Talaromyces proteolyticus]|uniref:WD domain protein n=1 Tax=Talaromyces proteolyticus TaxID=1131652 RepID=A0AAD4L191_9EURO|nr:WD domain protein [Talaromyces proteolyticus]KAH8702015.1 WD domain protein [Talaromyces proteolyticus]
MRPDGTSSATRANGRSDTSNGLVTSPRSKTGMASSLNGKASGHINGKAATNGSLKSPVLPPTYFGHDREEVTRILIQSLYDLGYNGAAASLSRESGYELESPAVAAFRSAVLDGQWAEAEHILLESFESNEDNPADGPSPVWGRLALAESADKNEMLFLLRQQKFLELLEARDLGAALMVLRQELTPLNHNIAQLHALSSLLMCPPEHLQEQSGWDGSIGSSREFLLSELSTFISPSVMIPDHRLAVLLDHVKQNQINQCLYHNTAYPPSLYCDHLCDRNAFPRQSIVQLSSHEDEVWYVEFSHDGTKLATASKDRSVFVYDTTDNFSIIHKFVEHDEPVAYATWSPDDSKLITCSRDNRAKLWDIETGRCLFTTEPFSEPVTAAAWAPDGESFVTASLDAKAQLCHWGLRSHHHLPLYTWPGGFRVQDCAITPDGSRLIAADVTGKLYVYNFETHAEEYCLPFKSKITSVSVSKDSKFVLINMAEGQIQLIDLDTTEVVRRFRGQKQGEYVIRSSFGGAAENFIVSGSEDSNVYIWHKENGTLVEMLEGHNEGCVNAVSWNPTNPSMFASAGDDHVVRIWSRETPGDSNSGKGRITSSNGFTQTSALRSTTTLF